jgi:hypothetical protein
VPLLDRLLVGGPPPITPPNYDEWDYQTHLQFCSFCEVYGRMLACWACGAKEHLTEPVDLPYWLY